MADSLNVPTSSPVHSSNGAVNLSDLLFASGSQMVYFLAVTLEMERELQSIEYAASGMFDLSYAQTLKQLELLQSVQTIHSKIQIARGILKWLEVNPSAE